MINTLKLDILRDCHSEVYTRVMLKKTLELEIRFKIKLKSITDEDDGEVTDFFSEELVVLQAAIYFFWSSIKMGQY